MPTIALTINSCLDCPFKATEKVYTPDSWDDIVTISCTKKRNRVVSFYYEWRDKKPSVPSWCPILIPEKA